jgi:Arc/MetJ-type ribon-helix-helix transcriptional regulator
MGGHIKRVLVNLTSLQIEELDEMVKEGKYSNRAEAVRDAVRILLEKKKIEELHKVL